MFTKNKYMKIRDFLNLAVGDSITQFFPVKGTEDYLKQLEEFKDVEDIFIVDMPTFMLDGRPKQTQTVILNEDTELNGKLYLYSMNFSLPTFDERAYMPQKDGLGITSTLIVNPENFMPYKQLCIRWSPEQLQDIVMFDPRYKNDERKYFHDQLDKILNNPSEYEPKGARKIMIRYYCE